MQQSLPNPNRCFIPVEKVPALRFAAAVNPTASRIWEVLDAFNSGYMRAMSSRFCLAVRYGTNAGEPTNAPTLRRDSGWDGDTGLPNRFTVPAVGWIKPRIIPIVVVFPEPFGPKNPNI
jgi:hypothetical protein